MCLRQGPLDYEIFSTDVSAVKFLDNKLHLAPAEGNVLLNNLADWTMGCESTFWWLDYALSGRCQRHIRGPRNYATVVCHLFNQKTHFFARYKIS